MNPTKRPIQRTLILGIIVFVLVLCCMLSLLTFMLFSSALYDRYENTLADILTYVDHNIDEDDLENCLETRTASETYRQEQEFLNGMVDDLGLAYLYIVIPSLEDEVLYNAISATSAEEFAAGETNMAILEASDAYTAEELDRYASFWDSREVGFFEESSDWGSFYTGVLPLRDSRGETVALACADIPIEDLHHRINTYLTMNTLLILGISLLSAAVLLVWIRRNVTRPIQELEKSARDFAQKSHTIKDFQEMEYERPEIVTRNEVQSLADAVGKMADDIIHYVDGILTAEDRAHTAEQTARSMAAVAYQDALTHVKSKTAYDEKMQELNRQIADGEAEFAIIMVDMNNLKTINDTYGHEFGDKYLVGACALVCQVYAHSPVYRVGGDEFVVILQGEDYLQREALYRELAASFRLARTDESRPAWERYSAAGGMAEHTPGRGETAEDVFRRADEAMYRDKVRMKAADRQEIRNATRNKEE